MRTVRDGEGNRYVLEKESAESAVVRDPETGEQRHVPTDELEVVDGESGLVTASRAVAEPMRRLITAAHDERAIGLLVELDRRDAVPVRTLLGSTDCCESDLHGMLAEFQAAGLIAETTIAGERGYETTPAGAAALDRVRSEGTDSPPAEES